MNNKRFMCIDIGYGDDCYITDNGERLSEMEIVDLLNEQQDIIQQKDNQIKQLNLAIDDLLSYVSCDEIKKQNEILKKAYLKIPKGIRDVWKE